ncbi:NADPH-dependent FMN reductase [Mechercharimyces sp. CAU 1602]|uniref:NADPH-dependent FMN reductase n=1 Tax=Mechercharimyces sp. CAU 1602 TaxID=2973933 RepID=UPI00216255F6|nr:NADPH-dependent FMN reductase [Mechercharimyces sp. CAU 1602]MCS1351865.1 NAD(P)H-dependent oxidoreductase [Mechercharimyces sp. CAU 1602]
MNILVVCGSPRREAQTRTLAHAFMKELRQRGIEPLYFDVHHHRLPLFQGAEVEEDEVRHMRQTFTQADGMIILSPEYHFSISGALKNALDYLQRDYFRGKPVAIAAAAGGGRGGMSALNHLRLVLRGLQALVISEQVITQPSCFNAEGECISSSDRQRMEEMVEQLLRLTRALKRESL